MVGFSVQGLPMIKSRYHLRLQISPMAEDPLPHSLVVGSIYFIVMLSTRPLDKPAKAGESFSRVRSLGLPLLLLRAHRITLGPPE